MYRAYRTTITKAKCGFTINTIYKRVKLLIDLDMVLFRGLLVCKDQPYLNQLRAANNFTERIIDSFDNASYVLATGGVNNFRKAIYPEYKANRDPSARPRYLYDAKQWFKKYWGVESREGLEADDLIGILHGDDTIIVSNDKDMKSLGGKIHNPVNGEMYDIRDPLLYFWTQMLCGDTSDNIPGVKNPLKAHHKNPPNYTWPVAEKLLEEMDNYARREFVEEQYKLQYGDQWFEKFDTTARLLWILRDENKQYYEYI